MCLCSFRTESVNDGSCFTSLLPLLLLLRLCPSGLVHMKWSLAVKHFTLNYSAALIPKCLRHASSLFILSHHDVEPGSQSVSKPASQLIGLLANHPYCSFLDLFLLCLYFEVHKLIWRGCNFQWPSLAMTMLQTFNEHFFFLSLYIVCSFSTVCLCLLINSKLIIIVCCVHAWRQFLIYFACKAAEL